VIVNEFPADTEAPLSHSPERRAPGHKARTLAVHRFFILHSSFAILHFAFLSCGPESAMKDEERDARLKIGAHGAPGWAEECGADFAPLTPPPLAPAPRFVAGLDLT